mmetsp:Transcript_37031/g.101905  ORF Transcript_37031/g.101905 Transcript_37031/m.101905 type:complete len:234 (-) Transcript_37031:131-832(-)
MLTDITDAADQVADETVLARCAVPILSRCHEAAARFDDTYPLVHLRVCGCMGAFLMYALEGLRDADIESSVYVMVGVLKRFAEDHNHASQILAAVRGVSLTLDAPAGSKRDVLVHALQRCNAGEALTEICHNFQGKNSELVEEAAMGLALLYGPEASLWLLDENPRMPDIQVGAIRGLGELARRGYTIPDPVLRQRVLAALAGAEANRAFESAAAVAAGLIESQSVAVGVTPS